LWTLGEKKLEREMITKKSKVALFLTHLPKLMIKLIMIMFMGRDYVSELPPPTGLLFITKVIYKQE
jgi:hypothetical protein